jgi:hypothetical protein
MKAKTFHDSSVTTEMKAMILDGRLKMADRYLGEARSTT